MSTASLGSRMESADAASTPEGILTEVEGARRAANCRDSDVVAIAQKLHLNQHYFHNFQISRVYIFVYLACEGREWRQNSNIRV